MGIAPMLEKEIALPGAELHFAIDDRDRFARPRQDHANVRGHVVRAFIVVLIVGVFGNELLKKSFHIAAGGRRRVLHYGQAATSVLNENRRDPGSHAGFVDLFLDLMRNLIGAFAVGSHFEFFVLDLHGQQLAFDHGGVAR